VLDHRLVLAIEGQGNLVQQLNRSQYAGQEKSKIHGKEENGRQESNQEEGRQKENIEENDNEEIRNQESGPEGNRQKDIQETVGQDGS